MKWSRYSGTRISSAGWRTSVELPASQPFGPTSRRYGCVWEELEGIRGYYEVELSGEIEDVELGPFSSQGEARRAIENALLQQYPTSLRGSPA
jgi:hypothetical protein